MNHKRSGTERVCLRRSQLFHPIDRRRLCVDLEISVNTFAPMGACTRAGRANFLARADLLISMPLSWDHATSVSQITCHTLLLNRLLLVQGAGALADCFAVSTTDGRRAVHAYVSYGCGSKSGKQRIGTS